ncbi:histone protein [Streptomyces sp. NPDC102415]|uniref:histone protein n=1 Tax=Streptomyces sp. NPDC102415 TaxID=3366173 RepID=UPI0038264A8A
MDTTTRVTLAAAIAAGYVIGRTKQGKLALGLLAVASGKTLDPKALIEEGVKKLSENPQFTQLGEQVRGELLTSGREALSEVTNRSVASLSENLQQRMLSLTGAPDGEEEGEDSYAEDEEEPEYDEEMDEGENEEEGEEEEEEEPPDDEEEEGEGEEPLDEEDAEEPEEPEESEEPEPARPSRRRSAQRSKPEKPTDRKPGPKNPPAKRAMARKAAERKPGPKNPPAKKAMARKAAEESAGRKRSSGRGEARPARRKR